MSYDHILVATLSTEPQGVTLVLDWLLEKGFPIREVAVIHTSGAVIQPAIRRLDEEFASGVYPGIFYRRAPIMGKQGAVADITSQEDVGALLRTLYRTLRAARQAGLTIHLSLTSGRKTMAVYGMVAAQLVFGEGDRAWHMISQQRWSGGEKHMHAEPGQRIQVLETPVLRWADAAAAAAVLDAEDPWEAIQRQQAFTQREATQRRKMFMEHILTRAEREVMTLLVREGLDNAGLARRLHKSERTIANQLTSIYRKFDEWRQFPAGPGGNRAALIAEFAPYLAVQGRKEGDM